MRSSARICFLSLLIVLVATEANAQDPPAIQVAASYSFLHVFDSRQGLGRDLDAGSFHGWAASVGARLWPRVVLIGEVSGAYRREDVQGSEDDIQVQIHAGLAGVRLTGAPRSGVIGFGQLLIGAQHRRASFEGDSLSSTDVVVQPGGGIESWWRPEVGIQAGADYRHVFRSTRAQRGFRVYAGIVIRGH